MCLRQGRRVELRLYDEVSRAQCGDRLDGQV